MSSTQSSLRYPVHDLEVARNHIREGRFQKTLALVTAFASVMSGLEVSYEHYRGSYSKRIMYTPVILSAALTGAGIAGYFSRRSAKSLLRVVSAVTLVDCAIGFYFHVRGIQRKPGGWRLPVVNMIMGPPVFAPLLFGTSAYLGLVASFLRREEDLPATLEASQDHVDSSLARILPAELSRDVISAEQDMREGRFRTQVAIITGISALMSGFEAWYSHYKNHFRYKAQWTPVILAPMLAASAFASIRNRCIATTALPALSVLSCADAATGFFYHARGVLRRPGGTKHIVYNILYGPPIFAPLLFGAAGTLGILASMLGRRKR